MANQYAIVVDDNRADRYLAVRALKRHGFSSDVLEFEDGEDAISYFNSEGGFIRECGPHPPPTLIFLDINMPRKNGFEFLDSLEQLNECGHLDLNASCVVVMLTSSNFAGDRNKAEAYASVSDYLEKPIDAQKLKQLLERHNHRWP